MLSRRLLLQSAIWLPFVANDARCISTQGTIPASTIPQPQLPMIICDGNSISDMPAFAYAGNWRAWPYWLASYGHKVVNVAVGATDIAECRQRAPVTVDTLVGLGRETWVIIFEGTNYLARNNGDVQATYDQHVAYCQERKAAGADVVMIGTIVDREPSVGYTTEQRHEFNRIIKTTWRNFADGVVDFAATTLGQDGAWADTSLFYDGIHPTDHGSEILAQRVLYDIAPRS